ncbi:DUF3325 family protein [Pseudozobellia sp. WGM2]|uniref:DUF3325 family protein n=1 Tax=Pseudozobellia sp. WGM2 TaxID=2787625 RepID=UPI00352D163D
MWSLLTILIFVGFFLNYVASMKMKLDSFIGLYKRVGQRRGSFKMVGLTFLILALAICINQLGYGSGVFIYFILLMTLGSLIVLLAPLKLIRPIPIFIFIALVIITEILFL